MVSAVAGDADHDRAGCRRCDRLAATRFEIICSNVSLEMAESFVLRCAPMLYCTYMQAPNSRESAIEECDRLVGHFDVRAKRRKRKFERYTYSSVGLTVGVTVISALQGIYQPVPFWAWILPVVSGLAAFCTIMVHATNAQELWLRARSMTHRLNTERFLFMQGAGIYSEQEETDSVKLFSNRLMDIWAGGHEQWERSGGTSKGSVTRPQKRAAQLT